METHAGFHLRVGQRGSPGSGGQLEVVQQSQRVEIVNGDRVGTVTDVARSPSGQVEALRVKLDSGKVVWIDQADVRYDHAGGIVMTNLDRADLRRMADERM